MEKTNYKVNIWEFERGWGTKVDEVKYFDNPVAAKTFVKNFNAKNDKGYVPTCYLYAEYVEMYNE